MLGERHECWPRGRSEPPKYIHPGHILNSGEAESLRVFFRIAICKHSNFACDPFVDSNYGPTNLLSNQVVEELAALGHHVTFLYARTESGFSSGGGSRLLGRSVIP